MSELVGGIIQRALAFVVQTLIPTLVADVGGPFGLLLRAALSTDYVKGLETSVETKLADLTSKELAAIEADCVSWASKFLAEHPDAQAFLAAVKPPALPSFQLKDDELAALLAAQANGTLRPKLGLT